MSAELYDPAAHEPLTSAAWDEEVVQRHVDAIVADAESALRDGGWPNHPLDDDVPGKPLPETVSCLYLGAAGVILALHALGSRLDLVALAAGALERYRAQPDLGECVPALWVGESGVLLVARVVGAPADDERLRTLIRENVRNETWELMWGSPGTTLAARFAGFDEEWRDGCDALVEQWDDESGLWTQHLYGSSVRYLGPAHGFAGNVHALRGRVPDDELRTRIAATLGRLAVSDGGLVNWPPIDDGELIRLQWCHGAPGLVATLGDLMPIDLLVGGAELTWRAGPLVKGAGLCHGTAGNGYALLRAHAVTGDDVWLGRARRFAVHALEQVGRMREVHGRGRYTLFTGDVGAALFARSCLVADARFPTLDVW
ncbi:MAG TPA: LanC-like protein [Gaiellaceae bacterium]